MNIDILLPVGSGPEELKRAVGRRTGSSGPFRVVRVSLDARKKPALFWNYSIVPGEAPEIPDPEKLLEVPFRTGRGRAVVVGSGPAGFFSADILSRAGYRVTLLEQGPPAEARREDIRSFESGGTFSDVSNYTFGEGGAGTFSDGKLTIRTKNVSAERTYVSARYVRCGAPEEILWLAHPHVGSDNLYNVVRAGRRELENQGVDIRFNSRVTDLLVTNGRCTGVRTGSTEFPADVTFLAPGHSAFPLLRMLINRGVAFVPKGFAVGFRIEHPRELINMAQWGRSDIPGLKGAEYRLTARTAGGRSVYSFCMCPGGKVVPAAWRDGVNIVNGVSLYNRDSPWSNAAIVAAVHPEELFPGAGSPLEVLNALESLEERPYRLFGGHSVPAARPATLCSSDRHGTLPSASFPFAPVAADYRELYPQWLLKDLSEGLDRFARLLRGFETGLVLGIETTSSAALRVLRSPTGESETLPGLHVVGEGSGAAGGIMSSAIDGIRTAMAAVRTAG